MKHLAYATAALSVLLSCGPPVILRGPAPPNRPTESPSGSTGATIGFAQVKDQIFAPSCIECHAQYSEFSSVKFEIKSIERTVDSDRMPKGGPPLTDEAKTLLRNWIAEGANEVAGAAPAPDPKPADPATWASLSLSVFAPKCMACHNPEGQAKFLDLSSRGAIFKSRNRVFDGNRRLIDFEIPESSYMVNVLKDPDEPMPPVYSEIPRLSSDEIEQIEKWIALGMP